MSRLIDADVLIEILTTAIRNMKGMAKFLNAEDDPEIKMEIKAYTDILNGVKEQPTIEPDLKWIPCNERLPEEDIDVLITYTFKPDEGDISHTYITITSYGDAYFGGHRCRYKEWRPPFEHFHSNYDVIAWMPLPEPFREVDT